MKLTLNTPVQKLRMVGPAYARRLKKLEIETIKDLLHHAPRRYKDYSQISKISQVQPGDAVTVKGKIRECKNVYTKNRKVIQKASVTDSSGQIRITWFNQPYIPNSLKPGTKVSFSGKIEGSNKKPELISPEYEVIKDQTSQTIHTGRLQPVYPETEGLSSKWLRSRIAPLIKIILPQLKDWLPPQILKKESLMPLKAAIKYLHFPQNNKQVEQARIRLGFDEMLFIQLKALKRKTSWQKHQATKKILISQKSLKYFKNKLPFRLTSAQNQAIDEIIHDLKKDVPMNRLLLGDVGSGKTVVASAAIYAAFLSNTKSVLMAPTDILANQHEKTIKNLLQPLGAKVAICTSARKENLDKFDTVVGTHALIYGLFKNQDFGLAIIDEQHRFGVEQRSRLIKKGKTPHTLTMSATPIPRTVALLLYGDLNLSHIDQMPPGRSKTKTWVVPDQKRESAYQWIKKKLNQGEQAFVVCPLIESSDHESMNQIRAATEEYERLKEKVFPDLKLELLHGKMSSKNKQKAINNFRKKRSEILVSTPVVEVGIDIKNATIMIIEAAERFGLAQLHQLRGRVGRGIKQSYCLLFTSKPKSGIKRLKLLETAKSGSQLAEADLKLRGPGDIYGIKQHGFADLKFASFQDQALIKKASYYADKIIRSDPELKNHPQLKKTVSNLEKPVEPN